jgi:hypothetical protein
MAENPSREFRWFVEMGQMLAARYAYRWIAVDGAHIPENQVNWDSFDDIVVADGDTLGETVAIAQFQFQRDPLLLFYAFVRPPLDQPVRQKGES